MADVLPFPARGEMFVDARGGGRMMRATWHHEVGLLVLSLWHGDTCTGTFRLHAADAPAFLAAIADGLAAGYDPAKAAGSGTSSTAGSRAR